MGHEVTLYASGDSQTSARLVPIVERALWSGPSTGQEHLVHLAELGRVAHEARQYDVVHSHLDSAAFPFGRFSPAPFIHTLHGRLDIPEIAGVFREFADAPLVSISDSQRGEHTGANWIATVHNGIPIEQFPDGDGSGGYLVFLGRISPEKGVAEAIDVAVRAGMPLKIAARMPLDSVDNPWVRKDWDYYQEHVKPRLDNPLVEFVGEVGDRDKAELLRNARAMVFPVNWPEPFGLTMVESLACGTPVIARPKGAAPEIVRHGSTGFLVDSVDEMVACCARIGEIDRAGCRADVEHRFSTRTMAQGYLDAYRVLLEGRCGDGRTCPPTHP
jgi:glycosyltransferase involved in cell wall biosynthesis